MSSASSEQAHWALQQLSYDRWGFSTDSGPEYLLGSSDGLCALHQALCLGRSSSDRWKWSSCQQTLQESLSPALGPGSASPHYHVPIRWGQRSPVWDGPCGSPYSNESSPQTALLCLPFWCSPYPSFHLSTVSYFSGLRAAAIVWCFFFFPFDMKSSYSLIRGRAPLLPT